MSKQVGDAGEVEIAGDDVAAVAVFGDVAIRLVLVADLADDDFEQVFHGGEAGGVAVLVDHDHHVGVFLLHLAHEVVTGLVSGTKRMGRISSRTVRLSRSSSSSSNMSRT